MAYSLDSIQDEILERLQSELVQPVYDDYIPNTSTLRRNASGEVDPYVVVQFGDIQPKSAYSMTGPVDDDYELPVYVQAISADPKVSRRIANKIVRVLLGTTTPWAGNMRKRAGFNQFTIDSSDNSIEAYASPVFFALNIQLSEEAWT